MKAIIEWLIYIEDWACRLYEQAAQVFAEDKEIHHFVDRIAGDEAMHYHFMNSALVCVESNPQLASDILLDQQTMDNIERPFKRIENAIRSGQMTKSFLLESIWETEQTEWNEIFRYVIDALKVKCPQFKFVGPSLQNHLRIIEGFFAKVQNGSCLAGNIKTLSPIWEEKILIVDDYQPISELLQSIISRDGDVHMAANGAEAFKMASKTYYAVIISDIDMPVMDGITFYEKMADRFPDVGKRFIFMSGASSPATVDFMQKQNLVFLKKPFKLMEIRQNVHNILDQMTL